MSKSLKDFLKRIPKEYRKNLTLIGKYCGNRSNVRFKFLCGCKTEQLLKGVLNLKRFDYCFSCSKQFAEKFICSICQTNFINKSMYDACINKCANKYLNLSLNNDYVICQICGFHAKSLGVHLNKVHNISSKKYEKQFSGFYAICNKSSNNYANSVKQNGSWLAKAIKNGENLTEYWEKVSAGVKNAILNDPEDKARRAEVMSKVNQSEVMKQKSSMAAKITSARPEILKKRTAQLKKWRDENPEEFYNKCTNKMLNSWQSKPETILFNYVSNLNKFSFRKNQRVKSKLFITKSKEKQIDMADKSKRVYIEFDGILHFEPKFGEENFRKIKIKDNLLDQHILKHNWTLIRISYDQFIYSTKQKNKIKHDSSYFKQECLDKLLEILNNNVPGIYKIGEAYGKY